jgi:hypothetical protein
MSGALANPNPQVTRDDLKAAGLSDEQIERCEELRAQYPYIEFLGSRKELERLKFVKWLHSQGGPEQR